MLWSESKAVMHRSALLVLLMLLSACGFRLQGVDTFPESFANTYIDAEDHYTLFYREMRIALEQGGVNVTSSPLDADAVIRIDRETSGQRVLTISGRNVPTEYDVYYSITYSVFLHGQDVVPSRTLTLNQDYTYDETLVLGKTREEDELRKALVADLVRQVSHELAQLQ
jgi:LPS-assembly lipoprotein